MFYNDELEVDTDPTPEEEAEIVNEPVLEPVEEPMDSPMV